MTNKEAIEVMFNEWKCIDRNDGIHCDRKCESCDLVMDVGIIREAFNMAISALQEQEAKTQLSAEGTTSDLISRQDAIEVIEEMQMPIMRSMFPEEQFVFKGMSEALSAIKDLPSAQPESEERTAESAQNVPKEDLISRKEAIDVLWEIRQKEISDGRRFHDYCSLSTAVDVIKDLPSAQPEPLVKESRTLVKDLVKDTISRQATIDALVKAIRKDPYYDTIMRAERRTDDMQ